MTRDDIYKAAEIYSDKEYEKTTDYYMRECLYNIAPNAFIAGANWRINSVWHKPNEEPARFCNLLLIELNNGEFELDYKFDAAITKRWSYVKDLLPTKEEKL